MSTYKKLTTIAAVAALAIGLAACGGGDDDTAMEMPPPPPPPTPYEMALDAIADAATAADAQAAYDAVKDDVTAAQGDALQNAVDMRIAALATAAGAAMQRADLMTAAGGVDTSATMTAEEIAAANTAIAALKAAIAAAVDVADTSMYQAQVDAAEAHVTESQRVLDHAAQTMALADAVSALQAIDLGNLSTQDAIDAADAAIADLRTALAAATELSDAEKAAAMTELATASRTVMAAQGRVDVAGQMMALSDAVAALAAIDLTDLSTQAKIDAAEAAIIALDLALAAATDLTAAQKLDATVDVTVAKRAVQRAQETLTANVGDQRTALTMAGTALGEVDLDDLDTAEKITAANEAIAALRIALAAATHLSDAEKAMYQTQLDTATETVRTAQTGMDREGRMMAQRSAITNAVTMARTAVNGVTNDSTDSEVASADSAIEALEAAIEGAADLPEGDTDVASAQGTLATLKAQLNTAKTTRTAYLANKADEDMKAMTALGKALHAALGGTPTAGTTALDNITSDALTATGTMPLSITTAVGAGALADDAVSRTVSLRTGDSAGSLGGWAGTDYAQTTGAGAEMVTDEARVYINKAAPRTRPFSGTGGAYDLLSGLTGAAASNNGYLTTDGSAPLDVSDAATDLAKVRADDFTHDGTQTHQPRPRESAVYIRGTYDGAPGEFRCETGCSSTNDGSGAPSALAGAWNFKPDAGAMVSTPDAHYLYYGWWVSKDSDGDPTAASAFAGRVGTDAAITDGLDPAWSGAYTVTAGSETITGSAAYAGHAAGKYAINNVLEASGHGGHFTADAEFQAKFSGANIGISGTIDNFRLNDGSDDPGWSVSLRRRAWGSDGAIGDAVDDPTTTADEAAAGAGTVWSIGGNPASASGTWGGTMYDETPGDPSATGPGDGSNIPDTVTGTFYSEFSTIGRMVGAFGADKQ